MKMVSITNLNPPTFNSAFAASSSTSVIFKIASKIFRIFEKREWNYLDWFWLVCRKLKLELIFRLLAAIMKIPRPQKWPSKSGIYWSLAINESRLIYRTVHRSLVKVEESYFALNLAGQESSFQLIDGFYQTTISQDQLSISFPSNEGKKISPFKLANFLSF